MDNLWKEITGILIEHVSEPNYHIFENSTAPLSFENEILTISVENEYTITWLKDKCESLWKEHLSEEFQNIIFNYTVKESKPEQEPQLELFPLKKKIAKETSQIPENNFSFDNFVVR